MIWNSPAVRQSPAADSVEGGEMSGIVFLNGEYLPRAEARVAVDDRGFVFGDGVYEVTRAVGGALVEAEAHLRRLADGMETLGIRGCMETSGDALREVSRRLLEVNGLLEGQATVYLQVTRGAAPRTHQFPPASTPPTIFLSAVPFRPQAELHEHGAAAVTHPDLRWARCDLKTVNLLPNVLAKQAAVQSGAAEALLLREGVLTEGSHSTAFAVLDGALRTHPLCERILPGITRGVVLRLAAELGVAVREEAVAAHDLPRASELFITGTTTDVLPLVRLDGRPVGEGRPGPVTRALQAAYAARLMAPVPAS